MEDISQLLNEINTSAVYKKIRDLEKNQKFEIKKLDLVKTPYGEQVSVKCDDFILMLPKSWTAKFNAERIDKLNQIKLFFVYKGTIDLPKGRTKHNIEFVV